MLKVIKIIHFAYKNTIDRDAPLVFIIGTTGSFILTSTMIVSFVEFKMSWMVARVVFVSLVLALVPVFVYLIEKE